MKPSATSPVGSASVIDETALSLINGLLRDRSIEKNGQDWIRRL